MWAVVAVVFVFRDTREQALQAGGDRLIATCISFALCQIYLLILPFTPMTTVVVIPVVAMSARRPRTVMASVPRPRSAAIPMVLAAMNPETALQQPMLRLVDTLFGVAVGVICKWIGSAPFSFAARELGRAAGAGPVG